MTAATRRPVSAEREAQIAREHVELRAVRSGLPFDVVLAIRQRQPYTTGQSIGRMTKGGTYIITSTALVNDDGKPRDLIAITRLGDVLALWPLANLEPIKAALS